MPKGSGYNSQGNHYNTPGGTNSSSGSSYHCEFRASRFMFLAPKCKGIFSLSLLTPEAQILHRRYAVLSRSCRQLIDPLLFQYLSAAWYYSRRDLFLSICHHLTRTLLLRTLLHTSFIHCTTHVPPRQRIDSNSNGSYYYSNDNGSTYYNNGSGHSRYTSSSGHTTQSYGGSSKK